MPPVVLKFFAGQGTGWTDKAATICFPFGEHKKDSVICMFKNICSGITVISLLNCIETASLFLLHVKIIWIAYL